MKQFIECEFYNHHEHADGRLFLMLGCCHKSCLNIATIKEFEECEMPLSNYPNKTKVIDGTRLLLNDGTLLYVAIPYVHFKKMILK